MNKFVKSFEEFVNESNNNDYYEGDIFHYLCLNI
jgi:hypothetical protein